jgi:hypothetical protein
MHYTASVNQALRVIAQRNMPSDTARKVSLILLFTAALRL